jgi:prolyl 4-hydroxylase
MNARLPDAAYRDITRWIVEQARLGQSTDALLRAMCDRGWDRTQAMGLIAQALGTRDALPAAEPASVPQSVPVSQSASQPVSQPASAATARPMPAPALGDEAVALDAGDRRVPLLTVMESPRIVLFGDFLSKDECDRLVEAARPRMRRSLTTDAQTGDDKVDEVRTSRGMFFQRGESPLVSRIEDRIARLLRWPVEKGEHLQVLHYRPGDRYEPHYDYFDPAGSGTASVLTRGGQRIATFLMYLREPERGGDTTFPQLGLRFAPRRGCALFFSYDRPDPSTKTLHGGAPVLAGEKWVATKWLREGVFV